MFSGDGLQGLDGTAWYHPQRLTIDFGRRGRGERQPGPGGARASGPCTATTCPSASGSTPSARRSAGSGSWTGPSSWRASRASRAKNLKLVERASTYSHNDPNSASPKNDFVKYLIPFLGKIGRR